MKAYVVSDDEYCVIEFAEHRATAQASGANELNTEFSYVTCRRAPEFDSWSDRGKVPWRVLIEEHGWSQECGGCYGRVYADEPGRVYGDNQAYCNETCKAKHAEHIEKITAQYPQPKP